MDVTAPHDAKGPCTGFRVLDFSTVVSGPLCAQILGDLGAQVIKIETPGGDFTRYTRRQRAGLTGFFAQFNRNKRSIVIDLKSDPGQQIVHRLAQDADVIVTNFRPGVADRVEHGEMLYDMIGTELQKWPTTEIIDRARRFGAPLGPAYTIDDFFAAPQAQHNRTWFESDDPIGGRMRYMRYPARFSLSPASLRHHPPRLGQHTDDILTAAGFDPAAIATLRNEGYVS